MLVTSSLAEWMNSSGQRTWRTWAAVSSSSGICRQMTQATGAPRTPNFRFSSSAGISAPSSTAAETSGACPARRTDTSVPSDSPSSPSRPPGPACTSPRCFSQFTTARPSPARLATSASPSLSP